VILQRPIERAQMQKLLATGKTDLLQFVSARTKRGFSAFLVRKPDGSIGFEFEAREPGKAGTRRSRGPAALRVLGPHPRDKKPVELHAGRYGPYVKHGDINATLPDRDKADSVTLDEALALLAEKEAKQGAPAAGSRARKTPATTSVEPRVSAAATPRSAGKDATAKRGAAPATARRRPTSTKPSAKRTARGR
jgi:topoisomerase IA-like protein